jgi:hypothetical protein
LNFEIFRGLTARGCAMLCVALVNLMFFFFNKENITAEGSAYQWPLGNLRTSLSADYFILINVG